jgi:hypothetical protein
LKLKIHRGIQVQLLVGIARKPLNEQRLNECDFENFRPQMRARDIEI